jgi:hypothetical protein
MITTLLVVAVELNKVARFFCTQYTKTEENIPNGNKICIPNDRDVYSPNGYRISHPFALQGPPKFTRLGIFGLKIHHLATLELKMIFRGT